ncbi:pilus assembly protein PilO [Niallia sp. 03133]|uniref:pilus assembly protein PilO n=1 Tax=Niallia sp. 03133 TaxID=3458060 RepID=UPI0040442EDF
MRVVENKSALLLIVSIIVLLFLAVGARFFYLMPLYQEADRKQSELQSAEQQVAILQSKINSSTEKTAASSMGLQKQVPVKRLLEQALLDIEKAEIISGSNLIEIKMNGTEADEDLKDEELTTADKAIKEANKTENNAVDINGESSDAALPNGIKKTSINITGEADTYDELEKLIESIQSSQRIMDVESLHITGTEEIISVEDTDQKIEFDMSVSIYYYPELNDLIKDIPPLESPKTSDKNNPFAGVSIEEDADAEEP